LPISVQVEWFNLVGFEIETVKRNTEHFANRHGDRPVEYPGMLRDKVDLAFIAPQVFGVF